MELYNDDCFNVFPKIKDKSINLFLLDLPYGQTACKWDSVIDLDKMWVEVKRMMKPNGIIVFFCTAKFGNTLINSNPKWFKYDLIWKKSRKVGFLSANKMPLRQHENIYVFKDEVGTYNPQKTEGKPYIDKRHHKIDNYLREDGKGYEYTPQNNNGLYHPTSIIEHENIYVFKDEVGTYNPQKTKLDKPDKRNRKNDGNQKIVYGDNVDLPIESNYKDRHPTSIIEHENIYVFDSCSNDDVDITRNIELRNYAKQVYKFIGKGLKTINKKLGHRRAEHFFYFKTTQFGLCTIETYNELIKEYKIDEMEEFLDYEILDALWEKEPEGTYNPQKTEGKPYKCKQGKQTDLYGIEEKNQVITKNNGDRHPTSIIEPDLGEIKGGYYRGENGKPFKRMPPNKEGILHPTSIIENTILEYNNPAKSLHRTQKPVELCEWLIKTYTNEDDVVMDFTMGSGTTGIACSNTNREFIGVEMDKEIFEIAEKRILDHLLE